MNQIHVLCLYIIHMFCEDMNHKHVLLSIHNVHDLLRYE